MAVTKIKAIKFTLYNSIKYITDPNKTDGTMLASGFNCEPTTAYLDFQLTSHLAKSIKGDYAKTGGADNLAYHLIQSFAKTDKITPVQAHEIGKQLADEVFQGKHEYVITTHIDKGHIHNHVIANAVSFRDYTKFRTKPYETVRVIREISDRLCRSKGLHVIENGQGRGRDSHKWQQPAPSWRDQLQLAIDNAIYEAATYQQFTQLLNQAGIEIKEGKHIAFRMPGQQRFIRGKSIGIEFTRERIVGRIAFPLKRKAVAILPRTPVEKKTLLMSRKQALAKVHELGDALLVTRRENVNRFAEYDVRLDALKDQCKEIRKELKELDKKNSNYRQLAKCLVSYRNTYPLVKEYEDLPTWKKKKFASKHESEFLVFKHAKTQLAKYGVSGAEDPERVLDVIKEQTRLTDELQERFRLTESRLHSLEKARDVIADVIYPNQKELREAQNKGFAEREQKIR